MKKIFQRINIPFARFTIFAVFFWFGILKLQGLSPAGPLVEALYAQTVTFIDFGTFYTLFALFEMLIGILFLFKKTTQFALVLLGLHLICTTMPLLLLPSHTWQGFLVPTLEGQYIIKNLLLLSVAITIGAQFSSRR